jgi:hypothetical protein
MTNFYRVIRGKVLYNKTSFSAGDFIFATPEEVSTLLTKGSVVEVPESEVPLSFLAEIDSGVYAENQSKPTNTILGILYNIYSLIKSRTPALISGKIPVDISGSTIDGGGGGSTTVDLGTKINAATMPTGGVGNLGWLSAIYKFLSDRIPALSNGKIPVDVASLNVTVGNALEIANDAGNPIPVSGTVTANTGLSPLTDTQLRASAVPISGTVTLSNTSLGITGTLPAFAITPTVDIGTVPGLTFTNTSFVANAGTNLNTSALALESGGNLAQINSNLPSNLTVSAGKLLIDGSGVTQPTQQISQTIDSAGFSASGASVLDSFFVQTPVVGTGVSYNQASGSINILSGTSTKAEFLARSVNSYCGSMRMRFSIITSQRIANSNFAVMLADLIGEGLAYTINSATSVTVAVPGHTFNARDVGQFIQFGGITGAAGVPGRYAIASIVAATSITFTVAGFPSSGTGTCTLFGWNYIRNLVTGTTATTLNVDAQRNGWATGDTVPTINTTASPGIIIQCELTGREVFWNEMLKTSAVTASSTSRASRYENIPDATIPLYVFIWNFNGTTAPASSTTFTLGHLSVESFPNNSIYLQGVRSVGTANAMPINVVAGTLPTVTSANLALPGIVADIASAAITTTATTSAVTPSFGCSYVVNIPVAAVSGTLPALDVDVQESDDTGLNWYTVYSFPRITTTGLYRSPKLALNGNRVRYAQTIGGTSPSFTRGINRLQCSDSVSSTRQLIDRTIVLTTLNSATPSINTQNCSCAQLVVNIGAATSAPILQLQGSDDNRLTWYPVGGTLTAVASSTVTITIANANSQFLRAIVSTAGTEVTTGYILIKGF